MTKHSELQESIGIAMTMQSKHAKYSTSNPISRYLVRQFLATIQGFVAGRDFASILDVGCGEGVVLRSLESMVRGKKCAAVDLNPAEVSDARRNLPFCQVQVGSAYELPFEDDSFDFVMCCEVLEHLEDPTRALHELRRVTSRYLLTSVPREPLWRALNMLRGAYWKDWGNTPDHRNHWSARSFERFVSTTFDPIARAAPTPWTVILAKKR